MVARFFDRVSLSIAKRWKGNLSWNVYKILQGIEAGFSERATYLAFEAGRCICCGGSMTIYGYVRNGLPFVHLACGKCDDGMRCDLYNKLAKTCGVKPCIAFQENDGAINQRVTILFNLVRMILRFINLYGTCFVDATRDARDAIPILWATRGIKAATYLTYYVFYKGKLPVDKKDTTIITVSDVDKAIKTMTGSTYIAAIVERMKRRRS